VVAVGIDGTPSAPSTAAEGTPAPTVGFDELYKQGGGTAEGGCALGGSGTRGGAGSAAAAVVALVLARRRRRSAALLLLGSALVGERQGRAAADDVGPSLAAPLNDAPAPALTSPPGWNLALPPGPHRPDRDRELAE